MLQGFAPHGGGFEGQHDAEFRQQAADAVEGGGALLGKALGGRSKPTRLRLAAYFRR